LGYILKIDFNTDLNIIRHDQLFASPEDVLPFLIAICREHPNEVPENVSAALLQARKNVAPGTSREPLKRETARLLKLLHTWELQQTRAA
jgi:hypothetical protein